MAQNKTNDYKDMLMDKVKENYLSIALGFLVFLVAITLIFRSAGNVKPDDAEKNNTADEVMVEQNKYIVKRGDSVSSIARDQLGSMEYTDEIIKLNNIKDANTIEVGQTLLLPEGNQIVSPSVAQAASPTQMKAQVTSMETKDTETRGDVNGAGTGTKKVTVTGNTYTVQKGDTLMIIAEKAYGDKSMYKNIMKANGMRNPNYIQAGMIIKLPR